MNWTVRGSTKTGDREIVFKWRQAGLLAGRAGWPIKIIWSSRCCCHTCCRIAGGKRRVAAAQRVPAELENVFGMSQHYWKMQTCYDADKLETEIQL